MQLIKGKRAVAEAISSAGTVLDRIVVLQSSMRRPEISQVIEQAYKKHIKVQQVSAAQFPDDPHDRQSQGIVAYVATKEFTELDDIVENPQKYPFILALDHIEDPYNFGAMIRTCEVFGVKAVIFPKDRNCQITPGVIKASSGAIYHIDLVRVVNLGTALDKLDRAGYWLHGTDVNNGVSLENFEPQAPCVLIMGNEAKGLSKHIAKRVHSNIHIPMKGKLDSLNVSVATGILVHAISQRLK